MIIAKKNKITRQNNLGQNLFSIILIKHKIKDNKGLFSLKFKYISKQNGNFYKYNVFEYEELDIPKNRNIKNWIFLLFSNYYDKDENLQEISKHLEVKEFLEKLKIKLNIKNF